MASDLQGAAAADASRRIPPGQRHVHGWPVSHYGPVPRFRPERWNLRVFGATAAGTEHSWTFDELASLPRSTVVADLHCASGPTSTDHEWYGIPATAVLDLVLPAPEVTHVMAWAEYGYSANLRLSDFTAPHTLLATHHNDEPLTAEHGFPLRLVVPQHSLQHLATGTPVTRIAAMLGYDNPAAYTAAFKKLLGRPPTAYRSPGTTGN